MPNGQTEKESDGVLSQATYRPTSYLDSSWEIVGEFINQEQFEPMSFEVMSLEASRIDPMFADYGGLTATGAAVRLHGSESERFAPTRRQPKGRDGQDDVEDGVPKIAVEEHTRLLEQARAEAFEAGRAEANAESQERLQSLEERYIGVLEDIGVQLNESIRTIEQQAVQLALQISEKLVGTIVEINPEYLLGIIKEAIQLSGGAAIKCVKVSPQDFEFISLLNLPKQFKEFDGTWSFVPDETIKSGCIVVMSGGEIDYQIDKAWERIRDQVVKVL